MRLCLLPFEQENQIPPGYAGLAGGFFHALAVRFQDEPQLELTGVSGVRDTLRRLSAAAGAVERERTLLAIAAEAHAAACVGGEITGARGRPAANFFFCRLDPPLLIETRWSDLGRTFFDAADLLAAQIGGHLGLLPKIDEPPTASVLAYLHFIQAMCATSTAKSKPEPIFWDHILQAVAYDPNFTAAADLLVYKALPMLGGGGAAEAEKALRQLLTIVPQHLKAAFSLAEFALYKGCEEEALRLMQEVLERKPDFVEGHLRLAIFYHSRREDEKALAVLDRLEHEQGLKADIYDLRGAILAQRGKIDAAIKNWRRALSLDPTRANVLSNLGLAMEGKGDYNQALAYYGQSMTIAPDWWGGYYKYARLLRRMGDIGGALSFLARALAINPDCAPARLDQSHLLFAIGEYESAETALLNALETADGDETRSKALQSLAYLDEPAPRNLRRLRRLAAGRCPLRQRLILPLYLLAGWRKSPYWLAVGRGLEERGRLRRALSCYRRAWRLDPGRTEALKAMGLILARFNRKKAEILLRQALIRWPEDIEIRQSLGEKVPGYLAGDRKTPINDQPLSLILRRGSEFWG